jgi:hypothetical protein
LHGIRTDLDWKRASVLKLRKDELPNKRKEISNLNKQIAAASSSTPNV